MSALDSETLGVFFFFGGGGYQLIKYITILGGTLLIIRIFPMVYQSRVDKSKAFQCSPVCQELDHQVIRIRSLRWTKSAWSFATCPLCPWTMSFRPEDESGESMIIPYPYPSYGHFIIQKYAKSLCSRQSLKTTCIHPHAAPNHVEYCNYSQQ